MRIPGVRRIAAVGPHDELLAVIERQDALGGHLPHEAEFSHGGPSLATVFGKGSAEVAGKIAAAEDEARAHACKIILLTTYSFQAPGFYQKLGWDQIHVPAVGDFTIGWWYIPLFIFVILFAAISSNETDGLDGLDGGVLLMAFSAFSLIAFMHNKMDLAAFCAAIAGALLAFLWFNIYPARFFMGDTGAISLGTTLGVVAMLTDSALVLFIIVFIYVLESGSAAIQLASKRFFGKKVLLAAPLHHHFELLGWAEEKVVVRFWIIGIMLALLSLGTLKVQ